MKSIFAKMAALITVMLISVSCFGAVTAHASDVNVDNIFNTKSDNDMFGGTTQVVTEAGSSLRTLVVTVAIIIIVIGLIVVGVQFTSKNSAKRQEAKSSLIYVIIGAVIVFGAVAIIAFSQDIANSLDSSLDKNSGKKSSGSTPTVTVAPENPGTGNEG